MKYLLPLFLATFTISLAPHREENESNEAFFIKTFQVFSLIKKQKICDDIFSADQNIPWASYEGVNEDKRDYDFEISSFQKNKIFLKYYHQTREFALIVAKEALIKLRAP